MKGPIKILLIAFISLLLILSISCGGCFFLYSSFVDQLRKNDTNQNQNIEKQIIKTSPQKDFILQKGVDFLILKALVYSYKANNQPLFVVEPSNLVFSYNEKNFKDFLDKDKINDNFSQSSSSSITIKEFKIVEDSKIKTKSKEIPYVRAQITIEDKSNNETSHIDAIIAATTSEKTQKTTFIISGFSPQKFNAIAVKNFVSKIQII